MGLLDRTGHIPLWAEACARRSPFSCLLSLRSEPCFLVCAPAQCPLPARGRAA